MLSKPRVLTILLLTLLVLALYGFSPNLRVEVPASAIMPLKIPTATRETKASDLMVSLDDPLARRRKLAKFIWGAQGLPAALLPDQIDRAVNDARYSSLLNLKQINRLTISMEWGLISTVYHFIPASGNGQLMIYHQGHDGDFIGGLPTIRFFLARGFSVIALSMPLQFPNNQPTVDLEGKRTILRYHHQLGFLTMKSGHPIQLFLTPVAASLNYAKEFEYSSISMTGVSGGGWTTTMYAAIDPRIARSYPVAGSLPLHLRTSEDGGDYEQSHPELMKVANYLELYVLGSHGKGRRQIQILNKYDPGCFAGERHRTYEDAVKARVQMLGAGEYGVYLDTSHRMHKISDVALKVMLDDITS